MFRNILWLYQFFHHFLIHLHKEFVNHKILDCIGDLYTSGFRIIASIKCSQGGHYLTNQLLRKVFQNQQNFSILEISVVTFLVAISGALSQWPIGKFSDSIDRRRVIIYTTFAAAFFALCAILSSGTMFYDGMLGSSKTLFYISIILFAFSSLPMFAIIFAHTNDFIPKEKFVAAGASLQFTFGMGAMGGPFLCSIFMGMVGPNGFFIFLLFFHSLIGIYGVYRSRVRPVVENPDSQFVAMPQSITPAGIELSPST